MKNYSCYVEHFDNIQLIKLESLVYRGNQLWSHGATWV